MYIVEKWPDILQKSCGVNLGRFLKYVWPFFNIKPESVNRYFKLTFISKQQLSYKQQLSLYVLKYSK